ncbi:5'-methylthioadenosine/adenosylhomocysteine nucleosidase [Helicobacter sp. faydin-H20]|uniref:5'-methylthioadenosine/adenosylhomocysteine nucleosidase n=1 Tax=Helicobacter anatolicus TaxID=2905874 RepID=UPI001E405D9A|nr:5'-methylthioadenosine/adenosylhomocysteine nucleosidase [Helicobacter anatolicus]MCE3037468.1 5'-methylthioadenosine/adenosylhomocysteine nucleosidase [Helicobacter anatolicus]
MIIGIIGAMQEEITPLLKMFQDYKIHKIANNTFYEITHKNIKIFIAYSKIGKVHASITATTLITLFKCEKIIFSGVAGGLHPDLKVGDLLLATKLCQHDVDISAFGHPLGFIPESSIYITTDSTLNNLAKQIAQKKGILLKEGIIASGDQFIHDANKKHFLIKEFKADAVEMEGAAVAVVCNLFNIPFCIFRSISDSADQEADISFDTFLEQAANTSAIFVKEIIEALV